MTNNIDIFDDVLYKWIHAYCSGSKMSLEFRTEASKMFKLIRSKTEDFKSCNSIIYRIQAIDEYEKVFRFDDLYYSFSNDIEGLKEVIHFDRNLHNDLILIIAKPLNQINLFELCNDIYENYSSRYDGEHEILSQIEKGNVEKIYYLKNKDDILDLKNLGIEVNIKDLSLKGKEFLKKYKN